MYKRQGLEDAATEMAKRLIDTFDGLDVDTIVINAAGCGSTLKEYGHLLRDDPTYAAKAATLAKKCQDVSEVLAELSPSAPRHPVPLTVAYHDACHLQHAQGVNAQPRTVQARVELDNALGQWRPGQFLTALLPTGAEATETLAVPAKAVQYVNGQPTVYILMTEKENTFKAREVAVGAAVRGLLPVTAGLKPNEQIVISGSFLLKAQLGRAGAGHDHSH